jgi:predicted RNase H-like HicB family nuclease
MIATRMGYTIEAHEDAPVWFARVRELPGCMTEADTFEKVGPMIEDAMRLWIETALDAGMKVPQPHE